MMVIRVNGNLQVNKEKHRQQMAAWRKANPEKAKAIATRYAEKNREKLRIRAQEFRNNNPERVKQYTKTSNKRNAKSHRANARKWNKANPDRRREYALKRKFGITGLQYEEMLKGQNGKCAICEIAKCKSGRAFAVDHDHATGAVRGLLCKDCNLLLGRAGDRVPVLKAAIRYLENTREKS